jgi:membrane protein implicated in regulation of membrane protease activity
MAHHIGAAAHGCRRIARAAGVIAIVGVGALTLLHLISVAAGAVALIALSAGGIFLAIQAIKVAQQHIPAPAYQRLLDQRARVIEDLAPIGRVLVQGENWAAELDAPFADRVIPAGHFVRVVAVHDLQLIVTPTVEVLLDEARAHSLIDRPSSPSV